MWEINFIKIHCWFAKPSSGGVEVNADNVGMVFQKYSSFPWLSVRKNIELGLSIKGQKDNGRVERMLKDIELCEHANKYAQYPLTKWWTTPKSSIRKSFN